MPVLQLLHTQYLVNAQIFDLKDSMSSHTSANFTFREMRFF